MKTIEPRKIKILALVGPTAVGKTAYAVELAKILSGEIISADSVQVYKDLVIGSARPTDAELSETPHHLIGVVDPFEDFTVADYAQLAKQAINTVFAKGKLPIVSGGTGLYLNSLIYEMDFNEAPTNFELRRQLRELYEKQGGEKLYERLKVRDPEGALKIHPHNVKRVMRAIEILEHTGKPMSHFENIRKQNSNYEFTLVALNRDRKTLYERIDKRVDIMMDQGLLDEVKGLVNKGLGKEHVSMTAIGYKELLSYLEGEIALEDAILKIKQNSRNYAKRQLTWFRRYEDIHWLNLTKNEIEDSIIEKIIGLMLKNEDI